MYWRSAGIDIAVENLPVSQYKWHEACFAGMRSFESSFLSLHSSFLQIRGSSGLQMTYGDLNIESIPP